VSVSLIASVAVLYFSGLVMTYACVCVRVRVRVRVRVCVRACVCACLHA
jgi:hypothetical protein